MAGMEQIEIHSKNYLIRWVNAKDANTISWTVHPHKKSINFGLFKHPGTLAGLSSVGGLPPLSITLSHTEDEKEGEVPEVVEKLSSIGLKQVVRLSKYEGDKFTPGKYEVPRGESGNYALVFDNTFSKSVSKTVTFFLLTFPTACQTQIAYGAQTHHSQTLVPAMSLVTPVTSRRSPKLGAKHKKSTDSLRQVLSQQQTPKTSSFVSDNAATASLERSIHTGILQKRRRKKHQGYARRFFCLDFTSSTLSYYHDRNSSALRGAIPLSLAAIGANAKTREISIDSGAEIWHLKASNQADFAEWKQALEKASRLMIENRTPGDVFDLSNSFSGMGRYSVADEEDWARLESLLSKISGSRDAVRRLCLETSSKPTSPSSQGQDSEYGTPLEQNTDYFAPGDKRPFWKRKSSAQGNANNNMFKRSVSAQLAVPAPGAADATSRGSTPGARSAHGHHRHEEGMHDHMKALLNNLDSVVQEFSSLVAESKARRMPVPMSAISRLSMMSVESQEYFDAEDKHLSHTNSGLLAIQHGDSDSDNDSYEKVSVNSETSSDFDDSNSVLASGSPFRSGSLSSILPSRAKSLTPLPLTPIQRRKTVQAPTVMPPSLIGFLRKNVGKDLSTISMPVSANEPVSLLQKAAEQLEYSTLLDTAAKSTDAENRLIHVTAFAISNMSNARVKERSIRKPFNPMLGETYELVREDMNFRFVAEKVSHRPVQLAFHAESSDWALTQSPLPSQKFWGKSSEIITDGKTRLILHTTGECFSWSSPTCFLRNIIAGEKYIEPVGTMTIVNESTGAKAVITFKAKGMFSGRSEDIEVQVFDASGNGSSLGIAGTWTSSLSIKENGKVDPNRELWRVGPLVEKAEKHYGMTLFAASLNEITEIEKDKIPITDSRLRQDQRALEEGKHDEAERLKNAIEEGQRTRRRELETKGEDWKPRWFTKVESRDGETLWKLKVGKGDGYWEERAKGQWSGVVDVLSPK